MVGDKSRPRRGDAEPGTDVGGGRSLPSTFTGLKRPYAISVGRRARRRKWRARRMTRRVFTGFRCDDGIEKSPMPSGSGEDVWASIPIRSTNVRPTLCRERHGGTGSEPEIAIASAEPRQRASSVGSGRPLQTADRPITTARQNGPRPPPIGIYRQAHKPGRLRALEAIKPFSITRPCSRC
jgi:hypothetical protein